MYQRKISTLNWRNDAIPVVTAALLWALFSFVFSPGFMSADSLYQWRQVIGEIPLTDAHPVVLVYIWRGLTFLWDDPGVFLVFNQFIYWAGLTLLSFAFFKSLWPRLAVLAVVGFWPPLFIHSVHLWKDQAMLGGFTVAVAAMVFSLRNRKQIGWIVLAFLGLFLGVAARHNSITTALPLFVVLGACFMNAVAAVPAGYRWSLVRPHLRIPYSVGSGLLFALLTYFTVSALNSTAKHVPVLSMIQVWDISAVSIQEKRNLMPSYIEVYDDSAPVLDLLAARYRPSDLLNTGKVVSFYTPEGLEGELTDHWLDVIRTYPDSYFHHRSSMFSIMMGWGRPDAYYPFTPGIDPNGMEISFKHLSDRDLSYVLFAFGLAAKTPVYKTWLYQAFLTIAGVLALLPLFTSKGASTRTVALVMISASAVLTWLPLYFLAPAPDFRYILWTVMATCIGFLLIISKDELLEA